MVTNYCPEVQGATNKFLDEYNAMLQRTPGQARKDLDRWEAATSTILKMSLSKKAEYADYVTRKTCALGEKMTVLMAKDMRNDLKWATETEFVCDTCSIGNFAYVISQLKTYTRQHALEVEIRALFVGYVAIRVRRNEQDDFCAIL